MNTPAFEFHPVPISEPNPSRLALLETVVDARCSRMGQRLARVISDEAARQRAFWTTPTVVDYLPVLVPPLPARCAHANLKSFTFSTGQTIKACPDCDHGGAKRRAVLGECGEWGAAGPPPPRYCPEKQYLDWCERRCPITPVQAWWAEQCEQELKQLGLTVWTGFQKDAEDFWGGITELVKLEEMLVPGRAYPHLYKRNGDRLGKIYTQKLNALLDAQQKLGPKGGSCLYCFEALPFEARRGTKYCLGTDHRQRHNEVLQGLEPHSKRKRKLNFCAVCKDYKCKREHEGDEQ